jgi:hypothetical protein
MADPWADPHRAPDPAAYAGPPATDRPAPPPYGYGGTPGYGYPPGQPGYAYPPPGYPAYGYPGWQPLPQRPRRPGQVIAAAVLAFMQSAMVLISSVYVVFFSSIIGIAADSDPGSAPAEVAGLATEGTVVGIVQLVSAVLLIVAGVMVLNSRRRSALAVLVAAFAVQVALCVYWAVRLSTLADDIPGSDPTGAFLAFTLVFLAGPAVGLGLVLLGNGRRWFDAGTAPIPA